MALEDVVQPLESLSVVDQITRTVRRSIIEGRLRPGETFAISDLRDQLGVSHIPVREALRRLEGQGLVQLQHRRSCMVAPISEADLLDIYRLRIMIEPELAAVAVSELTDEDFERLAEIHEQMRNGSPEDDTFWDRHYEFHRIVLHRAESVWSDRLLDQLWRATERYHRLLLAENLMTHDPQGMYDQHAPILDAARRRSRADIRRAWSKHLLAGRDVMASSLRAMRVASSSNGGVPPS